ncbi:MAG: hypothetical protein OXJ52_00795 [Oligoflexia bacterium]|nr:hypothetical protein [Oligoflexia bacterium]
MKIQYAVPSSPGRQNSRESLSSRKRGWESSEKTSKFKIKPFHKILW